MKKIIRILSVALVAVMVLSLSAVALADTPSVYIPKRLSKLADIDLDAYEIPGLKVKMSSTKAMFGNPDDPTDPCPILDNGGDYLFYFDEKPDWAGAIVSDLDGGYISIDVDDTGFGTIEGPLHQQPGTWIGQQFNKETGKYEWPDWLGITSEDGQKLLTVFPWQDIGDYPYIAGKDYGNYNVTVSYRRNGDAYKAVFTLKDSEDFFRTGMEGGIISFTVDRVNDIEWYCGGGKYHGHTDMWYISQVAATYPEGNYIIGVEADFRNDAKQTLSSYRISYAVSEKEIYKITYSPENVVIHETGANGSKQWEVVNDSAQASEKVSNTEFYVRYSADKPIFGAFYTSRDDWANDVKYANSGSGNKINQWVKSNGQDSYTLRWNNGKRIKTIKKGISSFTSPRVF